MCAWIDLPWPCTQTCLAMSLSHSLACLLPLQRFFVEVLYGTLAANARPTTASYNIDRQGLLQASLMVLQLPLRVGVWLMALSF